MKTKRIAAMLVCAYLLSSCASRSPMIDKPEETGIAVEQTANMTDLSEQEQDIMKFEGKWDCSYKTSSFEETGATLNIYFENDTPQVLFSSLTFNIFFLPVESKFVDNKLVISLNDEEHRAVISLSYIEPDQLTGTYSQYGEDSQINLTQVSKTATKGEFYRKTEVFTDAERKQQLMDFELYKEDKAIIQYSYTLNEREPWEAVIQKHDLDNLAKDKTDVELMKTLLFWVSENYKHGNPNGAPGGYDAISVMDFCETESGGYTNCRGLSIILADLCRVYGIPAKHITCMPKEAVFNDCHVVVVAYSKELDQWVMLDPTFKLILQDENGAYMNLQTLRHSLIHDKALVANEEHSYNGSWHSINDYRTYMTKNTFRFTSATDFFFGAEEGHNGNVTNMLIPFGYDEDDAKVTTTSDEAFWITP